MRDDTDAIRVLVVDDEQDLATLTVDMLEREDDRLSVENARSASAARDRLEDAEYDCIVSDYEMPGQNGIEFLESVRENNPDMPFILFTGKGSEELASDAISAGVSDYLQKQTGSEQYELLANRIDTAVGQYRAERELERQNDLFAKAQNIANVGGWEYDAVTEADYNTDEALRIHGLSLEDSLSPKGSLEYYHPDDRASVEEALERALEQGAAYDLESRLITEDGTQRWVRSRGQPQWEDGDIVRIRGILQDITDQKQREKSLERQNECLEEFARVVSHDIRSPLQVAKEHLERAERTGEPAAFERVRQAHDRMGTIIEDVLTLARQGQQIGETEPVDIDAVARDAWETVDTSAVTLRVYDDHEVAADPDRLRQLFENVFTNAAQHAGEDVTVTVGPIEPFPTSTRGTGSQPRGFYIEDTGPGIPEDEREAVFEAGYSTTPEGTGFGLSIVEQIVKAHDWDIQVTTSNTGGARFEITGIERSSG